MQRNAAAESGRRARRTRRQLVAEAEQVTAGGTTDRCSAYQVVGSPAGPAVMAFGAKELVVAIAPRDVLTRNLDLILGAQRPANSLTTAQLRALAQRDGFTGQGVGFVDVARAGALIGDTACRAAFTELARSVPRIAIGLDDITPHRFSIGAVVELPAATVAGLRGLSSSFAGYERMLGGRPTQGGTPTSCVSRRRWASGRRNWSWTIAAWWCGARWIHNGDHAPRGAIAGVGIAD
jgi:hypothetical protein